MKRYICIRRAFAAVLAALMLTNAAFAEPEIPDISSETVTSADDSDASSTVDESSDSVNTGTEPDSSTDFPNSEASVPDNSEPEVESSSQSNSSEAASSASVTSKSNAESTQKMVSSISPAANTHSRAYAPTPTVSPEWSDELNTIYNNACDWLKQNQGEDYFFIAMGGAGMPIDSKQYSFFLSTVSSNTYTDLYSLSMAAMNATFCGIKADNVNGIDLISQIANFRPIENSSTMSLAFALLALDSNPYKLPSKAKNNRTCFVDLLIKRQEANGSFRAENGESPLAATAVSLSALSHYSNMETVQKALNNGVNYLQSQYSKTRFENESLATISRLVSALSCLKININDSRFSTTSRNFVTDLQKYIGSDGGLKALPSDNKSDLVSTELAIIALTSVKYFSSPYITLQSLPDSSSSQERPSDISSHIPLWGVIAIIGGGILVLGGGAVICLLIIKRKKEQGKDESSLEHEE